MDESSVESDVGGRSIGLIRRTYSAIYVRPPALPLCRHTGGGIDQIDHRRCSVPSVDSFLFMLVAPHFCRTFACHRRLPLRGESSAARVSLVRCRLPFAPIPGTFLQYLLTAVYSDESGSFCLQFIGRKYIVNEYRAGGRGRGRAC